jgi:hypothetical protein
MNQADYFVKLNIKSNISNSIIEKIKNSKPEQWSTTLDQDILNLTLEDFKDDPEIYQTIIDLNGQDRLSVFRFHPNVCYQWHCDKIRHGAINMLLTGFDSFCAFGSLAADRKFSNVTKLVHDIDTYYLMNVKKFHTVFNFAETRHIISIGVPFITYEDSREYLKEKNLLC